MTVKHMVALGDSLSVGVGDELDARGAPRGWVRRLLALLGPDWREEHLLNLGVVNARTPQVRIKQLPVALRHPARCASLITGMNDVITKFSARHYERNYTEIVANLSENFPLVLTATLPDISKRVGGDAEAIALIHTNTLIANEIIRKASAWHDTVCFDAWAATSMAPDLWSTDGLHPHARGHATIAAAYRALIGVRLASPYSARLEKNT